MLLLGSDNLIDLISLISPLVWLRSVDLCILHTYIHHSYFKGARANSTWIHGSQCHVQFVKEVTPAQ